MSTSLGPVAFFGGCWNGVPASSLNCVLDPLACTDVSNPFTTGVPHFMDLDLDHCSAHDIPAQRCIGESLGTCVVGGCADSATAQDDDNCNLVKDSVDELSTLYGGCIESFLSHFKGCFWSEKDCVQSDNYEETWMAADVLVDFLTIEGDHEKAYCDCSDVRVGACRTTEGDMACAVDAKHCAADESFVSARTLMEFPKAYDYLDCRLCSETEITPAMKVNTQTHIDDKTQGSPNDKVSSDSEEDFDGGEDEDDSDDEDDEDGDAVTNLVDEGTKSFKSSTSEPGIVYAVVGSLLGVLILGCSVLFVLRFCDNKPTKSLDCDEDTGDDNVMAVQVGEML